MAKLSADVQFGTPQRGKELGSRPPRGRLCAEAECSTVLSTYNSATTCWLHTTPTLRPPLDRA